MQTLKATLRLSSGLRFDTIPHDLLMKQIESKISDGGILDLIQRFLKQNIMDGVDTWTPVGGTPQGAVMSPLLANLYLHSLDRQMQDAGVNMVRYADDFVILCQSEVQAQITLKQVQDWVAINGLTLHPDKTHLGNPSTSSGHRCMEKGQGFEFTSTSLSTSLGGCPTMANLAFF